MNKEIRDKLIKLDIGYRTKFLNDIISDDDLISESLLNIFIYHSIIDISKLNLYWGEELLETIYRITTHIVVTTKTRNISFNTFNSTIKLEIAKFIVESYNIDKYSIK